MRTRACWVRIFLTTGLDRRTSETSVTNRPLHTFYSNNQAFVGPPLGVTTPSMNCHSHYVGSNEQQDSKHSHTFIGRCQKQCVTNICTESNLFHLISFPVNLSMIALFPVTDARCGGCWQTLEHNTLLYHLQMIWIRRLHISLLSHTNISMRLDPEVGCEKAVVAFVCSVCRWSSSLSTIARDN